MLARSSLFSRIDRETSYVYDPGRNRTQKTSTIPQPVPLRICSIIQATQTSYHIYDGHGSTRALTDPNGAVTDTYDYDAFGNLLHSAATGIPSGGTTITATPNEFLFAGEQFDSDLGLYYNRARYLNVSTGRFWSMDTFEGNRQSPASLNKYLFAGSDPINRLDPSGNDDIAGVGAGLDISLTTNSLAIIQLNGVFAVFYGNSGTDCHIHSCYLEENSAERDTHPSWRAPGVDETFVTYKVFYKFRGQTIRVRHVDVILLEEFVSGSNDSLACSTGCTNDSGEQADGIFVDDVTAGRTGPIDVRQRFFVAKGQAKIFHLFEGVELGGGYSQIMHIYRKGPPGYKVEEVY